MVCFLLIRFRGRVRLVVSGSHRARWLVLMNTGTVPRFQAVTVSALIGARWRYYLFIRFRGCGGALMVPRFPAVAVVCSHRGVVVGADEYRNRAEVSGG